MGELKDDEKGESEALCFIHLSSFKKNKKANMSQNKPLLWSRGIKYSV